MAYELYLQEVLVPRLKEFAMVPVKNPDAFWIILPLLIAAIGMQVYFGRNRTEELGWNTAFGNSVTYTFVATSMLRYLYTSYSWNDFLHAGLAVDKLLLAIGFVIIGIYMIFGNYFHTIPKRLTFLISSAIFINGFAVVAVILIQSDLPLDVPTFLSALIFMILIMLFELLIRKSIRPSPEAEKILEIEALRKEEIKKLKAAIKKRKRTLRIKKIEGFFKKVKRTFRWG